MTPSQARQLARQIEQEVVDSGYESTLAYLYARTLTQRRVTSFPFSSHNPAHGPNNHLQTDDLPDYVLGIVTYRLTERGI